MSYHKEKKIGVKEVLRQYRITSKQIEQLASLCLIYQKILGRMNDTRPVYVTDPIAIEKNRIGDQILDLLQKVRRKLSYRDKCRFPSNLEKLIFHFQCLRSKGIIKGNNIRKWNMDSRGFIYQKRISNRF